MAGTDKIEVSDGDLNDRVKKIDELLHHIDTDPVMLTLTEYAGQGAVHGQGSLLTGTKVQDFDLPEKLPASFTAMAAELHNEILAVRTSLASAKVGVEMVRAGFDDADSASTNVAK